MSPYLPLHNLQPPPHHHPLSVHFLLLALLLPTLVILASPVSALPTPSTGFQPLPPAPIAPLNDSAFCYLPTPSSAESDSQATESISGTVDQQGGLDVRPLPPTQLGQQLALPELFTTTFTRILALGFWRGISSSILVLYLAGAALVGLWVCVARYASLSNTRSTARADEGDVDSDELNEEVGGVIKNKKLRFDRRGTIYPGLQKTRLASFGRVRDVFGGSDRASVAKWRRGADGNGMRKVSPNSRGMNVRWVDEVATREGGGGGGGG